MVRKKNPTKTRQQILEVTATLLHQHGFKGLRVDEVVEKTGLTKGALYHHFPNKQALGYAVVDELLHNMFFSRWDKLVAENSDPLDTIANSLGFAGEELCIGDIEMGCPLTNLAQEMSFEDEGFRLRINQVFESWADQIADLLRKGIAQGVVRENLDPVQSAAFLVSAFQGIQCSSKCSKNLSLYQSNTDYLKSIVKSFAKS